MSSNANTPPISVKIDNRFLLKDKKGFSNGHLLSVRSLYGQALQFSVLLENGALFTGLPAHSIKFKESESLSLQEAQMYDCIGDDIEVFTIETIRYAQCTVKTTSNKIYKGRYIFSIDFVGKSGLSYHPEQWKQFHCIETDCGSLLIYPQYRIKFLDKGLCENCDLSFPEYLANKVQWIVGS